DACQGQLGTGVDGPHQPGEPPRIVEVLGLRRPCHLAHPGEVGACGEGPPLGLEQDGAGARTTARSLEGGGESVDQRAVEGVQRLWPVEGENGDCAALIDPEAHMRNTPKRVSLGGALRAADRAKASTMRVSAGSMMPSSHNLAVE